MHPNAAFERGFENASAGSNVGKRPPKVAAGRPSRSAARRGPRAARRRPPTAAEGRCVMRFWGVVCLGICLGGLFGILASDDEIELYREYYKPNDGQAGWVHVSYNEKGANRKQVLTYDGKSYENGLPEMEWKDGQVVG